MKYEFALVICCLITGACNKDKEKMPAATQSGKNLLACKVDGRVHIYEGKRSYLNDNGVNAYTYSSNGEYFVVVNADKVEDYNDNIEMEISAKKPEINKEYIFSKQDSKDWAEYYIGQNSNNKFLTQNSSGYIRFTRFDETVVAGSFRFTAYNDQDDKVEVTEGFFDIVPD